MLFQLIYGGQFSRPEIDKDLALFLVQYHFDFPVIEESQPAGASWLFHSKTLESYLFLLGSSQREETREACCGILQSLTAQEGLVRRNMLQIAV